MTGPLIARATFVPADVEPAFATTEEDQASVWPDFAPDMHGYIARARAFAKFAGILAYTAVLLGAGVFVGWVLWGQS